MIDFSLDVAKRGFFDREGVMRELSRVERRVLSRYGAFVRRRARSLIRRRKKISRPGKPPTSWTGLLRDNIFFLYDAQGKRLLVGPVRIRGGTDAPRLLEHGGRAALEREVQGRKTKVTAYYRPRPYMKPAQEHTWERLPRIWEQSVR